SLMDPNRIGAVWLVIIEESIQGGHAYLPIDIGVRRVDTLIATPSISERIVEDRQKAVNADKTVSMEQGNVYVPSIYYAVDEFTANLKRLLSKPIEEQFPLADLMKVIGDIEEKEILRSGEEQFKAIKEALHAKVMILTGGPGTGKTTVIKGILQAYATIYNITYDIDAYDDKDEYPFILTAPTGRAAKRLSEATDLPAVT